MRETTPPPYNHHQQFKNIAFGASTATVVDLTCISSETLTHNETGSVMYAGASMESSKSRKRRRSKKNVTDDGGTSSGSNQLSPKPTAQACNDDTNYNLNNYSNFDENSMIQKHGQRKQQYNRNYDCFNQVLHLGKSVERANKCSSQRSSTRRKNDSVDMIMNRNDNESSSMRERNDGSSIRVQKCNRSSRDIIEAGNNKILTQQRSGNSIKINGKMDSLNDRKSTSSLPISQEQSCRKNSNNVKDASEGGNHHQHPLVQNKPSLLVPSDTRIKTKKDHAPKKMSQTTLFGSIVKSIREKDLSSCSTEPLTYSNSKVRPRQTGKLESSTCIQQNNQNEAELDCNFANKNNNNNDHLWEMAMRLMKEVFKIESLRGSQMVAIKGALKQPRQSQIIIMATGGGKSLCYQLPAVVLARAASSTDGSTRQHPQLTVITVVISPLIALMTDQVNSLKEKGVEAALISSSNGQRANTEVMQRLVGRLDITGRKHPQKKPSQQKIKDNNRLMQMKPIEVVYGTPELIQTDTFRAVLTELGNNHRLGLFAFDEAHCLSSWGHDFRPAYLNLSWLRIAFPHVPCMALTATATPKVIRDIRETLRLSPDKAPCHVGTFNRPNITYEIRFKDTLRHCKKQQKQVQHGGGFNSSGGSGDSIDNNVSSNDGALDDLIALVKDQHTIAGSASCSGIVYVHKRDDTAFLASEINKRFGSTTAKNKQNIIVKAAAYHGALKPAQREAVQKAWTNGTVHVAVATIAFGMGIDLKHVRYVVHWQMAKSVEGFYQESGRGGRDGLPAISVLYYSKEDASLFSFLLKKNVSEQKEKQTQKKIKASENGLVALEQMVDYCTKPSCRRKYLLGHFGEQIDPKKVCNKTCDFCSNPKKVENATKLSDVSKDVSRMSSRTQQLYTKSSSKKWDGQWSKPHGDTDNIGLDHSNGEFGNDWDDNGLCLTGPGNTGTSYEASTYNENDPNTTNKKGSMKGFVKAKNILDKYEKMECQEGKSNGFVNFSSKKQNRRPMLAHRDKPFTNVSRDSSRSSSIIIPKHLQLSLPVPLSSQLTRTTNNHNIEPPNKNIDEPNPPILKAELLKAELEKLKAGRTARMLALKAKQQQRSTGIVKKSSLLPPPSLKFGSKRIRR